MDDINQDRRRLFGTAAMAVAAAQLGITGRAEAQRMEAKIPAIKPGTHTSFALLKQIDAGVLNVGYAEAGPADGLPVILLHGWPYDIYSFVDVTPALASAGYRVIVPFLRGYGTTHFLSNDTVRNGQPAAIAVDTIAFMDALKIEKAVLAGFDWGARTVNIVSALWPERCKATVSVSGYLIGSQQAGKMPLPPSAELQWWYQFYFATDRGRTGYDNTGTTFQSSSGSSRRRNGHSMMPRSTAVRRLSTTPITSPSSYTIIAGDSVWQTARRNTTIWKGGLPKARSSRCRLLPLKAMPTAHHIRSPVPMRRNSQADMSTGPSRAA